MPHFLAILPVTTLLFPFQISPLLFARVRTYIFTSSSYIDAQSLFLIRYTAVFCLTSFPTLSQLGCVLVYSTSCHTVRLWRWALPLLLLLGGRVPLPVNFLLTNCNTPCHLHCAPPVHVRTEPPYGKSSRRHFFPPTRKPIGVKTKKESVRLAFFVSGGLATNVAACDAGSPSTLFEMRAEASETLV